MSRQMKNSGVEWIGDIPAEWEVGRLKTRFGFGKGLPITKENLVEKGISVISYGQIHSKINTGIDIKNELIRYVNDSYLSTNSNSLVNTGDFIFADTSEDLDGCGNNVYINSDIQLFAGYHTIILRSLKDTNNGYLAYLFKTDCWRSQIRSKVSGVKLFSISKKILSEATLLIPEETEQQKIVYYLDNKCAEIDAVIEKTKATIEEYKKLKQSIITEAVTKGIRGNRPMKDSGIEWIGNIPAEWETKTAFQLFSQVKNKNDGLVETNLLSLSYGKIKRKSIDTIGGLLPENFDGYNIIETNDIVLRLTDLQNDHKSLRVGIATERGIVTSAYLTLRNRSSNSPLYLYYYLHSFDVSKGFYGMGAGVRQGLNWDGLKKLKITIPPIVEQTEITNYLDNKCAEIDKLITDKTNLLSELENYKKSVIYEYVTGKKQVVQIEEHTTDNVIYPNFPAEYKAPSPRFAQAVLMSKILDGRCDKFHRVKLAKTMYTIETYLGFDFDTDFFRAAAGPLDNSIYKCENYISKYNKWYNIDRSKSSVKYSEAKNKNKYKNHYDKYFSQYDFEINRIISIFEDYDTDKAEIIATLFAAWNDAIIDRKSFTDEDIVNDILTNWHESKRRFSKDVWLRALDEMRENDLIPKGYGKRTVAKQSN